LLKEEKRLIEPQKIILMIDKKAIIRKIESLPDADLKKISEFLSSLEERPEITEQMLYPGWLAFVMVRRIWQRSTTAIMSH